MFILKIINTFVATLGFIIPFLVMYIIFKDEFDKRKDDDDEHDI